MSDSKQELNDMSTSAIDAGIFVVDDDGDAE